MAKRHGNYKGNPNGVKFSKTVTKAVSNWKYNKDILNSVESAKELRKEVNRVFHAANRRLQNIENSGVFSPAANAVNTYLENDEVSAFNKFAKFSTAGKDWNEIKRDYAAAIEFLKKPTSTASGAKQFENDVRQRLKLTPKQFDHIKGLINDGGGVMEYGNLMALIPSDPTKVADFFKDAANDIADEIENAAENGNGLDNLKLALSVDVANDILSGFTKDFTTKIDLLDSLD
jgi:hypothetical protein